MESAHFHAMHALQCKGGCVGMLCCAVVLTSDFWEIVGYFLLLSETGFHRNTSSLLTRKSRWKDPV